ncbi:S1 RNA-binding domain-containing protein 1 [Cephus cinctus]|uniref:S1 RNA-binding domain-containing protein 1 n=1 Tax=Cephus cinctus TaxID=211228 RepID=A0AAJ7C2X8_CEPCN|nr:S1 RNA-binding domain-containing protein 1 [Cephus cinctus]
MERQKRRKHKSIIIDITDSEDDTESVVILNDPDYEIDEKPRRKTKEVKRKIKQQDVPSDVICEDMKKNTKNRKRAKNETDSTRERKKIKLAKESIKEPCVPETILPEINLEDNLLTATNQSHSSQLKQFVECRDWTDAEYISDTHNIDIHVATSLVKLFKDDNTIPFIARYRKEMTQGMEPEKLRMIKDSYDRAIAIKSRATKIINAIDKLGKWTPEIHAVVIGARSLHELDDIYSLYKTNSKRSLAERARDVGLGPIADSVLNGLPIAPLSSMINSDQEGLDTEQHIKNGIVHIIADIINKDKTTFTKIRDLRKTVFVKIETTQAKNVQQSSKSLTKDNVDIKKYELYFNFTSMEKCIKPHQILAINRGESQKILSVKMTIPDYFEQELRRHCFAHFSTAFNASDFHRQLLEASFKDAYKRLIKPLVVRRVRLEMNKRAEEASIEVFASNLKDLLLMPPVRGKTILSIDPGFRHGCKIAVVSENGKVLDTATIFPNNQPRNNKQEATKILANLVLKHKTTLIALGNATACRETEMFLTNLIQSGVFNPVDVSYTIVNEAGASIYSCSPEAKSEFPDLDPNLISAVSIARRLQDPLAELIKVDPKHLGIGMYQHDLPEKQLQLTLNQVISETVSFVGVDINTASRSLLKRVAGLNVSKAESIIQRRNEIGVFRNRKQLLKVKGISHKSFEQCAGFIRIIPETANSKLKDANDSLNYLDQTWIHPESYELTNNILKDSKCDIKNLGTQKFIDQINVYAKQGYTILAKKFHTTEATIEIIIKGLTMKKGEDIRIKGEPPVFKKNLRSIDDLSIGVKLSGCVRNITHFGVFVDIGVETNGLIYDKYLRNQILNLGQRVDVRVISIERSRNRIGLELIITHRQRLYYVSQVHLPISPKIDLV